MPGNYDRTIEEEIRAHGRRGGSGRADEAGQGERDAAVKRLNARRAKAEGRSTFAQSSAYTPGGGEGGKGKGDPWAGKRGGGGKGGRGGKGGDGDGGRKKKDGGDTDKTPTGGDVNKSDALKVLLAGALAYGGAGVASRFMKSKDKKLPIIEGEGGEPHKKLNTEYELDYDTNTVKESTRPRTVVEPRLKDDIIVTGDEPKVEPAVKPAAPETPIVEDDISKRIRIGDEPGVDDAIVKGADKATIWDPVLKKFLKQLK